MAETSQPQLVPAMKEENEAEKMALVANDPDLKMVTLQSYDKVNFPVTIKVAKMSETVKEMMNTLEDCNDDIIPMPNVSGAILKKVIEWAEYHQDDPPIDEDDEEDRKYKKPEIGEWDSKFLEVDQNTLFEIILAANFMDVKGLLTLGCKAVALSMNGKTAEQMREMFNIEDDMTAAEHEQIRLENEWCEEK